MSRSSGRGARGARASATTEQLRLFDDRPAGSVAALAVRPSGRARRLMLRFVPPNTLELVVPRGTKPRDVESFIAEHRAWIAEARAEITARYGPEADRLPQRIDLLAVGRSWRVHYDDRASARPRVSASRDQLTVAAPAADPVRARELLRRWLLAQGRRYLEPWLFQEARTVGRSPSSVQVRLQRTRWGSCSPQGCISLNAGLLFLERTVVRYLLIHELCHLRHMNHSKRYWAHVARFEPAYERLDQSLAQAWGQVPLWAHARG